MLRVLTLSTLFPTAERPAFGVFVERQTLELAGLDDVEVRVIAPVGLAPWPLSLHPHYRDRRRLPEREDWKGLIVERPRYRAWPRSGQRRTPERMARAILPLLRSIAADFPFDAIDAEFFWPDGVAAMHVSRALGIPFSVKARGSDIHFWGKRPAMAAQILEAAQAAGGLVAVSAALKRDMVELGMEAGKIRVHRAGVDLDAFKPIDRQEAKKALGIDGPLIVAAGALIPLKGQRLAIEALAHLPEASLILVGGGPERAALEQAARPYGARVRFLGERPHGELPVLLGAADAMVLPSEREGLANVWIEALACGTPVVIPDVGGAREVVDRPEAGRIVPRDAAAIAEALRSILADPPAQEEVRQTALRFSWERNALEMREHLRTLVERH
jgi:teichuronic acid biosynthesis glycosyltransferase TuaC